MASIQPHPEVPQVAATPNTAPNSRMETNPGQICTHRCISEEGRAAGCARLTCMLRISAAAADPFYTAQAMPKALAPPSSCYQRMAKVITRHVGLKGGPGRLLHGCKCALTLIGQRHQLIAQGCRQKTTASAPHLRCEGETGQEMHAGIFLQSPFSPPTQSVDSGCWQRQATPFRP